VKKLENRVAIITGAGGGIGAAAARILAQSGAKVVVTDVIAQREQVVVSINVQGATASAARDGRYQHKADSASLS
jgi:NAD(P)-dependent dehydrogenase (short-subunit alcohol dehydrogenase family)